jgi:adenosyl cobinamide kinase/adenosyl cobinamide phosphate guanylyltransferase
MSLVFLIGGARSGKSELAVRLARQHQRPVVFIATMRPSDDELVERIARHRAERPGDWTTVEEPVFLDRALSDAPDDACVVIECLSLWVANVLGDVLGPDQVQDAARAHAQRAATRSAATIAVSNEVGMGVHPMTAAGRQYRDVLGRVNAIWSLAADHAWLVSAGRVLALQSSDSLTIGGIP